jgi:hypothetical protein
MNKNQYGLLCLFTFILTILVLEPLFAQIPVKKPLIYYYYPEHGSGGTSNENYDSRRPIGSIEQGKWQIDTVECFIKKLYDTTINGKTFDISDSVFTRALNEWNSSGMTLFLKKMAALPNDGLGSEKNILCFGAEVRDNRDSMSLGATRHISYDTVIVNDVILYISRIKYLELNINFWNTEQAWQADPINNIVDIFETATHECGHFIGLGGHDYPNGLSIMSIDATTKPFNGLSTLDKLYAISFYPKILPQHQNNCTPR